MVEQKDSYENQIKEIKGILLNRSNIKKNDEKARTFAPPDNADMPPLETEEKAEINLNDIKDLINEITKDIDMVCIIYGGKKQQLF